MAKERTEKKDKREKKEKRAEKDGVSKTSKKEKKEKKDKVALADAVEKELTTKVLDGLDQAATEAPVNGAETERMDVDSRPVGAVVPFASPLVEDKNAKKVLKSVKKGKDIFLSFCICLPGVLPPSLWVPTRWRVDLNHF